VITIAVHITGVGELRSWSAELQPKPGGSSAQVAGAASQRWHCRTRRASPARQPAEGHPGCYRRPRPAPARTSEDRAWWGHTDQHAQRRAGTRGARRCERAFGRRSPGPEEQGSPEANLGTEPQPDRCRCTTTPGPQQSRRPCWRTSHRQKLVTSSGMTSSAERNQSPSLQVLVDYQLDLRE